jgi:hypothetical protein
MEIFVATVVVTLFIIENLIVDSGNLSTIQGVAKLTYSKAGVL